VSVEVGPEGGLRYRLLDSIRNFALDRLRESGLLDDALAAHAAWLAEAADRCNATVRGKRQPDCLSVVRAERANIDAALTWSAEHDPRLGVRIATGFGWAWVVHGDGVAGATRVRAVDVRSGLHGCPNCRARLVIGRGCVNSVSAPRHPLSGVDVVGPGPQVMVAVATTKSKPVTPSNVQKLLAVCSHSGSVAPEGARSRLRSR
jgi:hypothetical protein